MAAVMFGLGWFSLVVLYRAVARFLARPIFTEVPSIRPEESLIPLSKGILYSESPVRKIVNTFCQARPTVADMLIRVVQFTLLCVCQAFFLMSYCVAVSCSYGGCELGNLQLGTCCLPQVVTSYMMWQSSCWRWCLMLVFTTTVVIIDVVWLILYNVTFPDTTVPMCWRWCLLLVSVSDVTVVDEVEIITARVLGIIVMVLWILSTYAHYCQCCAAHSPWCLIEMTCCW